MAAQRTFQPFALFSPTGAFGPLPTFVGSLPAATQLSYCGHSFTAQHFALLKDQTAGLCRLLLAQLLLTQHSLARAADSLLRCSPRRQSGPSWALCKAKSKPSIRYTLAELEGSGTTRSFLSRRCRPLLARRRNVPEADPLLGTHHF